METKSIKDRIKQIIEYYRLTAGEFAKKIGVQKSSISHLISGRNKPSFSFLSKLSLHFPDINLRWLLTGEGDMLIKDKVIDSQETQPHPINIIETDNKQSEQTSQIEQNELEKQNSEIDNQLPDIKDDKRNKSIIKQDVSSIIMVYNNDTFKILKKKED